MHVSYSSPSMSDWETDILELENQACRAFLAADMSALDRLWAPEFVVNSPLNRIHDRATVLELLGAGRIRHLSMQCVIERMVRVGDVVIVMGRDTVTDPPDARVTNRRFTNIWGRHNGSWRTIARHAQAVPAPA